MSSSNFHRNASRNRGLACSAEGCNVSRAPGVSPFCEKHKAAHERYGHPLGHAVRSKEYAVERELASKFLSKHADHAAVTAAVTWLDGWLRTAATGRDATARWWVRNLAEHGITALQILTEAAALFVYSRWHGRTLPDDERLTFAIGYRVLTLAPRIKRFGYCNGKAIHRSVRLGKVDRRAVGRRIRETLGVLFLNIALGLEAEEAKRRAKALALNQSFPAVED